MQSLETAIGLSTNFPTKASNYSQTKRKKNHQKITKRPTTVPIQTIPRQIERIEEMNWLGFAEFWTPSSLLLSSLEFCWMWWFPCKSGFFFPYFHTKERKQDEAILKLQKVPDLSAIMKSGLRNGNTSGFCSSTFACVLCDARPYVILLSSRPKFL